MAKTEIAIPEHLKRFVTSSQTSSDADAMASASISIPRISLRGRKFRLIEGGEEIRKPSDDLYGVILGVEPGTGLMAKTYYKKGYVSGDSSPPDCSSAGGVTPDAWIQNPVNSKCNGCPMNVFGSATSNNGKKTKACKDSKRLHIVEPDKINGTVFNMGVPVTSLKAMAEYGSMLKANGIPTAAVITKFGMKDSEFPELTFEFVGVLEEETLEKSMLRHEQKDWDLRATAPMLEHTSREPLQAPGADKLLEHSGSEKKSDLSVDEATSAW